MKEYLSMLQVFKDRSKRNLLIGTIIVLFLAILIGLFFVIDWKDEEPVITPIEIKKEIHEKKIKKIEDKIFIDSVNVWNADRRKRDSLRAIFNPR